ncbi:hypothetical protein F4781DRAFT_374999 [Annulohypoxylon bovei var. microspora]|nr:hypothetical protein F4781DRAFT_374999 [Annulohypoxylon bovei var. microspora]
MANILLCFVAILAYLNVVASFNLYPAVDTSKLATAVNVTEDCIVALNQSIPECDQTLFQMVSSFENYWWEDDNVTALCASNCSYAAQMWDLNVASACDNQYYSAYGKLVPAWTISERFVDGIGIACLSSMTEADTWCLPLSQNFTGSDIIRVDCDMNPSDPTCSGNASSISSENTRMANIYDDDVLCNDCFVQMLYLRVTSSYLEDSDYSDYLVGQLQDIADICSTSLPDITVRQLPTYEVAPPVTSIDFETTTTTTTSSPAASTTCSGQTIGGETQRRGAGPWSLKERQVSSSCDTLSSQYGVTTGDLQYLTSSDTCQVSKSICLPAACKLAQVGSDDTCTTLAVAAGNVTTSQFLKWNAHIMGLCDSLTVGQYVCTSAPGLTGSYSLAVPPLGTGADAGNQQRGGAGGVVTPTTTATTSANSASGGNAPSPTQDGLVASCNNYAMASADDGCFNFAGVHSIPTSKLYEWNPIFGSDGAACTTSFWASEYYCIGVWASTTAATPPTSVTAPGPTQSGIIATCDKFAETQSGDGCETFAARNNITPAHLYEWNSVLGVNGANCNTKLLGDEWYCVGVSGSSTTTTPTSTVQTSTSTVVTAPGATQTGIVSNCNKFAEATPGQGCFDFAAANGITTTQLYAWNTVLGPNGANCGTMLWGNEWYCVGVST